MKARAHFTTGHCNHSKTFQLLLVSVSTVALCGACATSHPAGVVQTGVADRNSSSTFEPGEIAVVAPGPDANFGFEKGSGKIESSGDAAGTAARNVLLTPYLGDPLIEGAAGVVEFVVAPFAAGYSAT